jgi:peroxiredoxin
MSDSPELAMGSPALDFRLSSTTGVEISLSDYKNKTSVVLFFVREFN